MNAIPEIIFTEMPGIDGHLGIITLNRPHVLNSLNHAMIRALTAQLQHWAQAPTIKAVIIRAEGRAFCAGGDLRAMYEDYQAKRDINQFFHDEYQLNRLIFHYPKPYIALLDGITMGGGVGISIHGSHQIATERLSFAMPETGIGFFPDVGGSYFLSRLPQHAGYYLGLTGKKINDADCFSLGIVTHRVASTQLTAVLDTLAKTPFDQGATSTVSQILESFQTPLEETTLLSRHPLLSTSFSKPTIEEILFSLENSSDLFLQETATSLYKKSPTSLKVSLLALQRGAYLDFDACMQMEYCLVQHFLTAHDFLEGIRALIIDKDQKPHWQPNSLTNVDQQMVIDYFK